ncbi:MAG: helix-turn-helix transcriptional regulator [Mycobacterium sp.]|uniref:helix-turn-helix domain-containing protein n=1 Tax=Mycobacterium sp. TaxID=1785 RepID=UPI003C6B03B4
MGKANHLGEYLRARRARVTPAEVGLVPGPRRRLAGLRRDELAMLAGISSEYLQRLEQGRDRHPSAEVLDSIARALRMDAKATAHLHQLAYPTSRLHRAPREQVSAAIAELIDQFPMPTVVVSRYHDVLAANPIARALSSRFEVGENLSRWQFLDPAAKQVYPDWDEATALTVRGLRQGCADDPDDPRLLTVISELSSASERFKQLWEQADVGYPVGISHVRHPEVGDLYLTRTQLDLAQSPGQYIITLHAPADSASMRALDQLRASLPKTFGE